MGVRGTGKRRNEGGTAAFRHRPRWGAGVQARTLVGCCRCRAGAQTWRVCSHERRLEVGETSDELTRVERLDDSATSTGAEGRVAGQPAGEGPAASWLSSLLLASQEEDSADAAWTTTKRGEGATGAARSTQLLTVRRPQMPMNSFLGGALVAFCGGDISRAHKAGGARQEGR